MLVTLKDILQIAEARKIAIGSFNTPNLTSLKAILNAAEALNQPVIIMHAQIHEEMGLCKMDEMAPIMLFMADRSKVPVCVHLDHGTDLDYIARGLKLGFTSVMYDGSALGHEMNYANTAITVGLAKKTGASVEAEIGSMKVNADGSAVSDEDVYTDPDQAKDFAEKTGIDALACAFGTVHGFYFKQPRLDFERLARINRLVDIPLVMHGGSGVSEEDYRRVIDRGIRKINYYTYMAKAGGTAASEAAKTKTLFHDIEIAALKGIQTDVESAIRIFSGI